MALAIFVPLCASAQTIGTAATVRNEVLQVQGSATTPIDQGENVVRNEVVRTGADSATKLVFVDSTNLAVGPTSTVTLDKFVFAGDSNAKSVTVNLVRGAFRFTTGTSDKKAYEIRTPVATIGVRGTELNILSIDGQTTVTLGHGASLVCTRDRKHCGLLSNPGDTIIVTLGGIRRGAPGGGQSFSFAAYCGGDGLCDITQFASLPTGRTVAALCGR